MVNATVEAICVYPAYLAASASFVSLRHLRGKYRFGTFSRFESSNIRPSAGTRRFIRYNRLRLHPSMDSRPVHCHPVMRRYVGWYLSVNQKINICVTSYEIVIT